MKDLQNKSVEHLFLDILHKKENISMNSCSLWLYRYYEEIENPDSFNSCDYKNQDERIDSAFPGMPEKIKNLFKLKSYRHRANHHEETGYEKRIEKLETEVAKTEYKEFVIQQWWES